MDHTCNEDMKYGSINEQTKDTNDMKKIKNIRIPGKHDKDILADAEMFIDAYIYG